MFRGSQFIFFSVFLLAVAHFSYGQPSSLPENVRVDLNGTLEVFVREDLQQGNVAYEYFLNRGRGVPPVRLIFNNVDRRQMRSGIGISVRGLVRNGDLEVSAANVEDSPSAVESAQASTAEAAVIDERSALVLVVNLSDIAHSATELANMQGYYFGTQDSMKDMYQQISFGQLVVAGNLYSTVNTSLTAAEMCDNPFTHANEILSIAESQFGIDRNNYRHRIFALPRNMSCGWTGYANVGCGSSCSAFNRWSQDINTTAHEMAHNLGMAHAGILGGSEYSDYSSFMGYSLSNGVRALDGAHHWQMGWYQNDDSFSIDTVTTSGQYQVASFQEVQPSISAPSILRIDVANGDPYFLSARKAEGYDSDLTFINGAALNGVNIHRYGGSGYDPTVRVAQLDSGQSYTDGINNLTITQNGAKDASGVVLITIDLGEGECIEGEPNLSLTPSFTTVGPDTSYSFTVTLANTDSVSCDASTFALNASNGSFDQNNSLTVAANDQGSKELTITGGSISQDINFTVGVVGEGATTAGTLTIDATAPEEVTNLAGAYTRKGKNHRIRLSWTDSVDNDLSNYEILQNGVLVGTTSQNNYTHNLSGTIAPSYDYRVKAVDALGNVSAGELVSVETSSDGTGGGGNGNGRGGGRKPK